MKDKKNKLLKSISTKTFIIISVIVFILTAGATFALISWNSSNTIISGDTRCFGIGYTNGGDIDFSNLVAMLSYDNTKMTPNTYVIFRRKNNCTIYGKGTITANVTSTADLSTGALKYRITNEAGTLVSSGSITSNGNTIIYGSPTEFDIINSATYYINFWLDANYIDNSYLEATFSGSITATARSTDEHGDIEESYYDTLYASATLDTTAGVDFSKTSEAPNTNGLYILSSTQNNAYPILYYRGGGTDSTTGEELVKNNLIFADTCWKIVRTTSTGGLRLIYNGTPNDGKCNRPNNTDNGRSTSTTTHTFSSTSTYYYGTDYSFNETSGLYSLSGTISSGTWASDKVGLYTCFSRSQTGTCTSLTYLDTYKSATQATVYTYTSTSNVSIGTKAFNSSYTSPAYVGYMYGTVYTCSSGTGTGWYYAPDVTYSNGTYTLTANASYNVETKDTISGTNLNYQHYTCGSSTDTTCTSVRYVYYVSSSTANYITLTNGNKVEDALSEMLDYNTTSSTIKGNGESAASGTIDYWYKNTISGTSYESKIDKNEIFCNDRSIYQLNGWNPDGGSTTAYLNFGAYGRLHTTPAQYTPTLTCSRDIDKFTVSTATTGNKALTYPVGLLTADETSLAGGKFGISNTSYYLYTGQSWWTNSSYNFTNMPAFEYSVETTGAISINGVYNLISNVRPVINLASGYTISSGDGTTTSPYIVGS